MWTEIDLKFSLLDIYFYIKILPFFARKIFQGF
jgi:hypothetical protein